MLSFIMLSFIMLSYIMLSFIMLSVAMMCVVAPNKSYKYRITQGSQDPISHGRRRKRFRAANIASVNEA